MLSRTLLALSLGVLGCLALLSGSPRTARGDETDKSKSALALPKELQPKLFTLQAKDMPMDKVLAELAKQTGNPVEDRRQSKEGTKIKIDLKQVTFWQALEAIAKGADARVSIYQPDNKVALVDGPYLALPVSFSGLFRVSLKRIDTSFNLETETRQSLIFLDVAWEPRFKPLLMENRPDALELQDDKGHSVEVGESGTGKAAVGKKIAAEIVVRVGAPHRSAGHLGLFKGKLSAIGPVQLVTVSFDKLAKITDAKKARKVTKDGVTVHLRELNSDGDEDEQSWTAGIVVEYSGDSPKLESFQTSLINNDVYLEKEKDGIVQRFPPNGGYETSGDDEGETKSMIRYHFNEEPNRKLVLGNISEWKLVYKVPGKLVDVPIPFEFKDVPLP
jgi:hypothetical protein